MRTTKTSLQTLVLAALALAVMPAEGARAAQTQLPKRPNILFVFTDDQRWDTIGALGNPEIKTPNLDRLVKEGFRFDNAYCMGSMFGAVCLPSRTMLATGLSLWRIPYGRSKTAPPGTPILPVVMKEAGYVTFHHGKAGNACTFANARFDTNIETRTHGNPLDAKKPADAAIEFIQKHDGRRPFFIYLAPPVPHDPRVAPPETMNMYDPAKVTLSKNFMPQHPFDNGELRIRDEMLAPFPRTPAATQPPALYQPRASRMSFALVIVPLSAMSNCHQAVIRSPGFPASCLDRNTRHGLPAGMSLQERAKRRTEILRTDRATGVTQRTPQGVSCRSVV